MARSRAQNEAIEALRQGEYKHAYEAGNVRLGLPKAFQNAKVQEAHPLAKGAIQTGSLGPTEFGGGEFDLGKAIENLPSSAVRLITGIPGAIYHGGKAAEELVRGKPEAALQIGKSLKEVALHPGKFATEEPASFGLMLAGGESAASRALGVAEGARTPLSLYGDIAKERTLPASILRRTGSKLADQFRESVLKQDPNQAVGWSLNRELKGGVFKPGQVDVQHGMGEAMTKMAVAHGEDFLHKLKPKEGADQASLYSEGYVRRPETAVEDATKRLDQLQREQPRLTKGQARLNQAQQDRVQQFLKMPDKQHQELEGTARVAAMEHKPLVDEMVNVGHLEPNQPHAAYVPFALEHGERLGRGPLHYEQNPGVSPAVKNWKAAIQEHKSAQTAVKTLQDEIRGRGIKGATPGKAAKLEAAKARVEEAHAKREILRGEVQHMKANGLIKNNGEMYPHLQDPTGAPVHTEDIKALWDRETNHRPVGFISHKDQAIVARGGRGFGGGRPGSLLQSRTGEHALSGAYDNSWNAIARQFRNTNRNITGHLNENQLAARFGVGGKDGLFTDKAKAEALATHYNDYNVGGTDRTPMKWVVRSIGPDKIVKQDDMQHVDGMKILEQFGLPELKGIEDVNPYGKWSVMPKVVSDRIDQHLENLHPNAATRGLTTWTSAFRHAALYPTPRWPIGVTQENAIRAVANKVSPFSLFKSLRSTPLGGFSPGVGSAVTDEWRRMVADPSVSSAEKIIARQHLGGVGLGSMYGADLNAKLASVFQNMTPEERTGFQQFKADTGPRQTLESWEKYKHVIGHAMQRMETNAREAGVGKLAIDQTKGFTNKWKLMVNKQDDLVKAYAKGTLDPNKAVKFTEDLFDMYGNWNHVTPTSRLLQRTATPFGLWWLNSMKFVLKTMPKDHPMGTAALAALVTGTKSAGGTPGQAGYSAGNQLVHLPLMGAIELNPLHYSPFDIARGGAGPPEKAAEMLSPQIMSLYGAAKGINPLTSKKTEAPWEVNLGRAAENALTEVTPFGRLVTEQAREGAKPNEQSLNPFATVGPKRGFAKTLGKYLSPIPLAYPPAETTTPKFTAGKKPKGFGGGSSGLPTGVKPKGFK